MYGAKRVSDYVSQIAEEFGTTKEVANTVLQYGMKNFCKIIMLGEDLRIPKFGHVYFNKTKYVITKVKRDNARREGLKKYLEELERAE